MHTKTIFNSKVHFAANPNEFLGLLNIKYIDDIKYPLSNLDSGQCDEYISKLKCVYSVRSNRRGVNKSTGWENFVKSHKRGMSNKRGCDLFIFRIS